MEIEKKLVVSAARERVWASLMDPHVMTGAVPGMQSIDVISPTEYVALMKVKISFVSAKFQLRTRIVEQREPEYLRAEGTGEDASVASSLKQTSEIFLTEAPEGGTQLRIKVKVDLLGRLGTFGLSVMKTKADRMWDEFGKNLAERLEGGELGAVADSSAPAPGTAESAATISAATITKDRQTAAAQAASVLGKQAVPPAAGAAVMTSPVAGGETFGSEASAGWLSRLLGGGRSSVSRTAGRSGGVIRVEIRQIDQTVAVEWPVEAAGQCQDWLRELLTRS
jgi:carbon monoxide dehydrogenase subunit G